MKRSAVQCSEVKCISEQCSAVQCSVVRCSKQCPGLEQQSRAARSQGEQMGESREAAGNLDYAVCISQCTVYSEQYTVCSEKCTVCSDQYTVNSEHTSESLEKTMGVKLPVSMWE